MSSKHADVMLREMMIYVSLGWQLVPTFGIAPDGKCGCNQSHAGSAERTKGKHPILASWQTRPLSTEEQVQDAVERWPLMNVGVLLGAASGIVDIEFDCDQGKATAERLGLHLISTPTYRSGRSIHRLLRWDDSLPAVAVRKIAGLECRIGGDARGAQSILPPSRHWAGGSYGWLNSLSPSDVDIAPMPDELIEAIITGSLAGQDMLAHGETPKIGAITGRSIIEREIGEGERNDALFRGACRLARNMVELHRGDVQADFVEIVRSLNLARCNPPLEDDEVLAIARSAVQYGLRTPTAASVIAQNGPAIAVDGGSVSLPVKPQIASNATAGALPSTWLDHGLSCEGGIWGPGNWTLTVIASDPPRYRLHVPAWIEHTPDKTGDVVVTHETLLSAARMSAAILSSTHMIMVRGNEWARIWMGDRKQPGILTALFCSPQVEAAPPEMQVWASPAEYLLRAIDSAPICDAPDETGMPVWMADVCWTSWSAIFEVPVQQGRFPAARVQELFGKLGMMRRRRMIWPEAGDGRKRYYAFDRSAVEHLRCLILGRES